jgi:hypothetical protein
VEKKILEGAECAALNEGRHSLVFNVVRCDELQVTITLSRRKFLHHCPMERMGGF